MSSNIRSNRKERVGTVISDKMDKTVTVRVDWVTHHPVYKKLLRRATKFKAHDEKNSAAIGDTVKIRETRPLSKTKRWTLVEIIKKGSGLSPTNVAEETIPQRSESKAATGESSAKDAKKQDISQ